MNTTIFEAKGLTKRYGSSLALQDINMTIDPGDIYGFVGENGAGKTTLMKVIGGLVHPTDGKISLFGKSDKKDLNYARRQVGFLIEMPALYPHLNAEENLMFYCRTYGIKDDHRIRIVDVLQAVSLSDAGSKKTSDYSLGMRQRLGLAIALLNNPKFLVLDEPINGLDPSGIVEVRKILEHLVKERGVTILISSHILNELQLLATKFGFIHHGRLIKEISAADLLKSAETRICIQTPNPALAAQILKYELQLESIVITEAGEIQIPKENTDLEKLMSILLQKGIQMEGINVSTPNLENYYMDLIGGANS
ncbi:ABC-2 type transport system ATP-binding protein [Paenibacillus anaericanus]|uniref:ABC transporter ATP-binding protein n=1 Tax=Paenibacillus anaericanus TaxID=170367 RepID=UPI002785592C|nr:ABC transporter ATP-binding protein [Paenibacillus anaericanus]MDQ0086821.1 ABC-2 type transport system ATP-binding protein [Paenibacillus anaericanus]